MRRNAVLVAVAAVVIVIGIWIAFRLPTSTASSPPGIELGVPLAGQNAVEFVGRADQTGPNFVGFGYLTRIYGLTQTLVFTSPIINSEATAHFTYYATSTLSSRSVISGVFVVDSIGTIVYYYHATPSASFADPQSFATGIPILTATVHYQDVLNVQAPNLGIASGDAEIVQTDVAPFTLSDGKTYHMGRVGLTGRSYSTGEGTRTNPVLPASFVVMSGYQLVTGIPGQVLFVPIVRQNMP
jgi:hypothetical protein